VPIPIDRAASPPPPVGVGLRPPARAIRGWQTDSARREALGAFIAERGSVSVGGAVLSALYWLERDARHHASVERQRGATGEAGGALPGAPGCEIMMLYPFHRGRRVTDVSNFRRRLARLGLVESMGEGWYRTTALGRRVAEAMPGDGGPAVLRRRRPRPGRTP
jgi:hypothetical protein